MSAVKTGGNQANAVVNSRLNNHPMTTALIDREEAHMSLTLPGRLPPVLTALNEDRLHCDQVAKIVATPIKCSLFLLIYRVIEYLMLTLLLPASTISLPVPYLKIGLEIT